MDTWRGHFPITHFVLGALLNKRSGVDAGDLSRAEAVLLTVCEFWSVVATRQLPHFLDSDPVPKLLVAFEAFSEIGAVRVASALRVAVAECANVMWHRERALDFEARLLDTEDAIDRLIAQFASVHVGDDWLPGWSSAWTPSAVCDNHRLFPQLCDDPDFGNAVGRNQS